MAEDRPNSSVKQRTAVKAAIPITAGTRSEPKRHGMTGKSK